MGSELLLAIGGNGAGKTTPAAPVRVICLETICLWVYAVDPKIGVRSPQAVQRFLKAQMDLWQEQPLVPFRYGQNFGDQATLNAITERRQYWQQQLERLGPCGEISLFFSDAADSSPEQARPAQPQSGRDYLKRRQQIYRRRQQATPAMRGVQQKLKQLEWQVCQERIIDHQDRQELVLLVHRAAFKRAFQWGQQSQAKSCRGPFPPWSFVGR